MPRVRTLRETAARTRILRDHLAEDLSARCKEVTDLTDRVERLSKVGELFRALMDKLVEEQKTVVEGLVTEGLRAIFHDEQLSFEADVVQRANRVEIDLFFRSGDGSLSIRDHPLDGFGGGMTSVCSVILKVLAIRRLGRFPFMVLDETLPGVSDEYVDHTGRFLQHLCRTMGIDVLFVTHIQDFLLHADAAYSGTLEPMDGDLPRLGLKRIRGGRDVA